MLAEAAPFAGTRMRGVVVEQHARLLLHLLGWHGVEVHARVRHERLRAGVEIVGVHHEHRAGLHLEDHPVRQIAEEGFAAERLRAGDNAGDLPRAALPRAAASPPARWDFPYRTARIRRCVIPCSMLV
ncbi:hypothetical protein WME99_32935 [Sorangium sp. So ce136]|uniref:hypothetical protein n=1 Tax=Sorangium sp. So ce136 TaxID=3133284 RepID=UPI003F0E2CBC